ncbi:hypothetical protein P5V15_000461 [Pogonomyrmex californicus]
MTSEIRGSQPGNTDFSIARILANECPNAASLRKRREFSQERGDHPRQSTGDRERKGHAGQPEERLGERETPGETYRDVPVVVDDRDDGSTIRQTDLTWLQYTRYRPPRLPRRSFTEKRVKRHMGDHPRIPFSSSQLQVLEDRYRKSAYLSKNDVVEMSATLRLPQSKIKIWFQNRRARQRRELLNSTIAAR